MKRIIIANRQTSRRTEHRLPPMLRFSPTAWAKLLYLRDLGPTEVGGFGISAVDDLLHIEDVRLVRQRCTPVTVAFEDVAVAAFFDEQVDRGLRPEQFGRIWIHTHPGDSAEPSWVDEATFERVFGRSDWAVMFILARGGATYARLRFNIGPGSATELAVQVDYSRPFVASAEQIWEEEHRTNVSGVPLFPQEPFREDANVTIPQDPWHDDWPIEWLDDPFFMEYLDVQERRPNEPDRSLFAPG
jgi:hypothetical protein